MTPDGITHARKWYARIKRDASRGACDKTIKLPKSFREKSSRLNEGTVTKIVLQKRHEAVNRSADDHVSVKIRLPTRRLPLNAEADGRRRTPFRGRTSNLFGTFGSVLHAMRRAINFNRRVCAIAASPVIPYYSLLRFHVFLSAIKEKIH